MSDQLQPDLDRLQTEGIPVDITFEQGRSVLQGLDANAGEIEANVGLVRAERSQGRRGR